MALKRTSALLPGWSRGDTLRAELLNLLPEAIAKHIVGGNGILVRKDGVHTVIENPAVIGRAGAATAGFVKFQDALVTASTGDYLACVKYDPSVGSTTGAAFNVAKPPHLRKTPYDGETIAYLNGSSITYTYDATNPEYKREAEDSNGKTETQEIRPSYHQGEHIIAAKVTTGVSVSGSDVGYVDISSNKLWARVRST